MEFPRRFAKKKKRMRLHKLSGLLEKDNQSMFSTKEKKGQKESNQEKQEIKIINFKKERKQNCI